MARQDNKGLHGTVGPVCYRVVDGEQYVYGKTPKGKMKQTAATKKSAVVLGKASRLGQNIRSCFDYDIAGFEDGQMNKRLTGVLAKSLHLSLDEAKDHYTFDAYSFKGIADLEFNQNSPLKDYLRVKPEVIFNTGEVHIFFPEADIRNYLKFPKHGADCELTVAICLVNLKEPGILRRAQRQTIKADTDHQNLSGQEFNFTVPEDCLCIVSVFLKFYSLGGTLMNSKKFSPAAIIDAVITPGTFAEQKNKLWTKMHDLNFD